MDQREEFDHLQIGPRCCCQNTTIDENALPVIHPMIAVMPEPDTPQPQSSALRAELRSAGITVILGIRFFVAIMP